MGRVQHGGRTHGGAKGQAKTHKTSSNFALTLAVLIIAQDAERYSRDVDQILKDLDGSSKRHLEGILPDVLDISGGGEFPCAACDRHFVDDVALQGHLKSKLREAPRASRFSGPKFDADKRRLKQLDDPAVYDGDAGLGRGVDNKQRPARTEAESPRIQVDAA